MKQILLCGIIITFLNNALFAQYTDTATVPADTAQVQVPGTETAKVQRVISPAPRISLFQTSQFDSLLSLLPNGDSIQRHCQVVAMGIEESTGILVVVVFDDQGNPQKLLVKPAEMEKTSAAQLTPGAPGAKKVEQNGRTWFIIETTLKSSFTYPVAYGIILDDGDNTNEQAITGLSLLTIGGTLYGSYLFTKNRELGYGKVALMNFGSTVLGGYYPRFISLFLENATKINKQRWYQKTVIDSITGLEEYTERPKITDFIYAGTSMIGFPLGIFLGSRLNIIDIDDYGKASLMEYFSQTFGALAFALPVFYYDDPVDKDLHRYMISATGLSMCMIPAGFYGGYWLARNSEISSGRGTFPYVTGGLGSLTGLGLAMLGDEYHGIASTRAVLAATIAGYAGGSWLGLNYHPQIDYRFWQAVFIGASSAAGAAVGVSFPLIANANNHRAYILSSLAGGWTGFFLGERFSLDIFDVSERDKRPTTLNLSLPGLAALPLLLTPSHESGSAKSSGPVPALPIAAMEWRF
ncbi:MAG: hypothetical protein JW768_10275 [Chitinispirillaceae bacterium]|nr:hypothetical protein [Chitinispirillaceae bacterium]